MEIEVTVESLGERHHSGTLAQLFEAAFLSAWNDLLRSDVGQRVPELFRSEWTKWTIGHRGERWSEDNLSLPVFVRTLAVLDSQRFGDAAEISGSRWSRIRREENYIDLLLAGPQPPLIRDHWGYPASYEVLLEHEYSGTDLETEMWKLLFFYGRLKVIVGYDDFGEPTGGDVWKATWLRAKIRELRGMWRTASSDRKGEEYLLLVGRRKAADGGFASWRAVTLSAGEDVDPDCRGWLVWSDSSLGHELPV
jgi:hypothetical protein